MTLRAITLKIEDDLLEKLDAFAVKNRLNRSEAIRLILRKYLDEVFKNEPLPPAKVEHVRL